MHNQCIINPYRLDGSPPAGRAGKFNQTSPAGMAGNFMIFTELYITSVYYPQADEGNRIINEFRLNHLQMENKKLKRYRTIIKINQVY
jgi:hypothetical protein